MSENFSTLRLNKDNILENIFNTLSKNKSSYLSSHLTNSNETDSFISLGAQFKFIGREKEFKILHSAVQSIITATNNYTINYVHDHFIKSIIVPGVGGQRGIGKTRFALEFYKSLQLTRF